MALNDAVIVVLALALPIWLLVEQVVWWASSKESQAEVNFTGLPAVRPAKKTKVNTRQRPAFPPLPRKVA